MMRLAACALLLALQSLPGMAQVDTVQKDLVDVFIGKKSKEVNQQYRAGKKVHFSLFPAAVNVPGGGRAVITAVNAAFYLDDPSTTNLSNVYFIPNTNLSSRYGLYIRTNLWTPANRFNLPGDYRLAHFPQYSWGLGGDSPEWDESLIDSDYVRFYQTLLINIFDAWYTGPGYALDYHYNIEETDYLGEGHLNRYEEDPLSYSVSSGITFNLVHDSRTNAINPPRGAYLLLMWRWNAEGLGSTYDNNSLYIDGRKYISVSKQRQHILAFRSYYWTVINGHTPYLDLPATNWAPSTGISSRGFQTGRYRSNAMLYGEAEQRFQLGINGLFGMVAFINVASASEYGTQHFRSWTFGGGAGLRFKLNKYSQSNLCIDSTGVLRTCGKFNCPLNHFPGFVKEVAQTRIGHVFRGNPGMKHIPNLVEIFGRKLKMITEANEIRK